MPLGPLFLMIVAGATLLLLGFYASLSAQAPIAIGLFALAVAGFLGIFWSVVAGNPRRDGRRKELLEALAEHHGLKYHEAIDRSVTAAFQPFDAHVNATDEPYLSGGNERWKLLLYKPSSSDGGFSHHGAILFAFSGVRPPTFAIWPADHRAHLNEANTEYQSQNRTEGNENGAVFAESSEVGRQLMIMPELHRLITAVSANPPIDGFDLPAEQWAVGEIRCRDGVLAIHLCKELSHHSTAEMTNILDASIIFADHLYRLGAERSEEIPQPETANLLH